jgi:Fe-S-cluster-containing hydrogenase component 2
MKVTRKIIKIDEELCDGCGRCVPSCAEGAIEIIDRKAHLVSENYCDGLGACLGECPNGAITIEERKAEDFDEEAVDAYLKEKEKAEKTRESHLTSSCPSNHVQAFTPKTPNEGERPQSSPLLTASTLSHWPVQINLVPPTAPFLQGADLLIAADCTPLAYPTFHKDFLAGKVVMIGCPKFDDVEEYVLKFKEIFEKANIRSVTVLIMEVPCCSGLPFIVKKAMDASGKYIPTEEIVISTRGDILKRDQTFAA